MCENEEAIIVVGISGVTCGGKTTTAQNLAALLPDCQIISQDDYFLDNDDPRHKWIPELNHVNYDIISSLDMERMYKDVLYIMKDKRKVRINHKVNININDFDFHTVCSSLKSSKLKILILEGFSIFNYEPLLPLIDLKYYFTLTKEECLERRNLRVYDPPDVPGYFELCAWPEHLSQLKEVRSKIDNVSYFSGTRDTKEVTEIIVKDIFIFYKNHNEL